MISNEVLEYYTAQTLLSDPGPYAPQLEALPHDMDALHHAINGLFIHIWKIRKFHPEQLRGRPHAVFVRSVRQLLEQTLALNPAPLNDERPEHERLIVDCRSFALLLCAVLRRRGVPACVHCGFAGYLEPTHLQDHWVCEFWNGKRWVMEDPDVIKHDLAPDDFVTGAREWERVQAGRWRRSASASLSIPPRAVPSRCASTCYATLPRSAASRACREICGGWP
jgi:hypothetical protein